MSSAAIMNTAPVTVRDQDTVSDAVATLVSNHLTNLPVVDSDDRYVGTFGIHDLLALLVPRVALAGDLMANLRFIDDDPKELRRKYGVVRDRPVSEFVNRNAPTLVAGSPGGEAVRLFCRNHVSLPVVDRASGRVLGTLSCWDTVRNILGEP